MSVFLGRNQQLRIWRLGNVVWHRIRLWWILYMSSSYLCYPSPGYIFMTFMLGISHISVIQGCESVRYIWKKEGYERKIGRSGVRANEKRETKTIEMQLNLLSSDCFPYTYLARLQTPRFSIYANQFVSSNISCRLLDRYPGGTYPSSPLYPTWASGSIPAKAALWMGF